MGQLIRIKKDHILAKIYFDPKQEVYYINPKNPRKEWELKCNRVIKKKVAKAITDGMPLTTAFGMYK